MTEKHHPASSRSARTRVTRAMRRDQTMRLKGSVSDAVPERKHPARGKFARGALVAGKLSDLDGQDVRIVAG